MAEAEVRLFSTEERSEILAFAAKILPHGWDDLTEEETAAVIKQRDEFLASIRARWTTEGQDEPATTA